MNIPDIVSIRNLHDSQVAQVGGKPGLRDEVLLSSAIGRVGSAMSYADLDPVASAAMLCHAILKNHAFLDGNKRAAYGALMMTLTSNGLRLEAENAEVATRVIEAAGSSDDYQGLEAWLRDRVVVDDTYQILHDYDLGNMPEL